MRSDCHCVKPANRSVPPVNRNPCRQTGWRVGDCHPKAATDKPKVATSDLEVVTSEPKVVTAVTEVITNKPFPNRGTKE